MRGTTMAETTTHKKADLTPHKGWSEEREGLRSDVGVGEGWGEEGRRGRGGREVEIGERGRKDGG